MDYIREELLRQRAALARLLLGGAGEEKNREERSGTEGWPVPETARRAPGTAAEAVRRYGGSGWEWRNGMNGRLLEPSGTVWRRAADAGTALWAKAPGDAAPELEEDAVWLMEYGSWQDDGGGAGRTSWLEEWKRSAAGPVWPEGRDGQTAGLARTGEWNGFGGPAVGPEEVGEAVSRVAGGTPSGEGQEAVASRRAAAGERTAVERSVVELVRPAEGEPADPRALSRVFQRDARRYDGGFTLY